MAMDNRTPQMASKVKSVNSEDAVNDTTSLPLSSAHLGAHRQATQEHSEVRAVQPQARVETLAVVGAAVAAVAAAVAAAAVEVGDARAAGRNVVGSAPAEAIACPAVAL